jgi:hypothetical protein
MHLIYKKKGKKRRLVKSEVPIEYKHTSPYPTFDKCLDIDGKRLYKIEKSHELRCLFPDLKPIHILKLFNKEWPKLVKEQREIYSQIANRMSYSPISGVRPDTFNGI